MKTRWGFERPLCLGHLGRDFLYLHREGASSLFICGGILVSITYAEALDIIRYWRQVRTALLPWRQTNGARDASAD